MLAVGHTPGKGAPPGGGGREGRSAATDSDGELPAHTGKPVAYHSVEVIARVREAPVRSSQEKACARSEESAVTPPFERDPDRASEAGQTAVLFDEKLCKMPVARMLNHAQQLDLRSVRSSRNSVRT